MRFIENHTKQSAGQKSLKLERYISDLLEFIKTSTPTTFSNRGAADCDSVIKGFNNTIHAKVFIDDPRYNDLKHTNQITIELHDDRYENKHPAFAGFIVSDLYGHYLVDCSRSEIRFEKSGVKNHEVKLNDPALYRAVSGQLKLFFKEKFSK